MRKTRIIMLVCMSLILMVGCSKKETTKQDNTTVYHTQKQLKSFLKEAMKKGNDTDFPQIDYATEERMMFHNDNGFFVYDCKKGKIVSALDLQGLGIYKKSGSYDTIISVNKDGTMVRFLLQKNEKEEKNYYFDVEKNKIETTGNMGDIFKNSDFINGYEKASFSGKSKEDIVQKLGTLGVGESNVAFLDEGEVYFLGYPTDVFMQEGNMFKNLSLVTYNVKSDQIERAYLFDDYVSVDQETTAKKLSFDGKKRWFKMNADGSMYFDVDELTGTKAATGEFGTLVVGNVLKSDSGTITVTFEDAKDLDVSLKPVLAFSHVDEEQEPQVVELDPNKSTYRFTNVKKGELYYIDYYPTKDAADDQEMEKIDKANSKLNVTISNE